MKKTLYSFILFGLLITSCSSVKVLDSWQGDNLSSVEEKNILVVARTDNKLARIAFEEAMANDLRKAGFKATESYLKYSNHNPDEKMKEGAMKALIEKEGFQGVVMSVVKDYNESQVTEKSGGYYAGGTTYYGGYPGYYGGFYGYYNNPYSYSTYGNYVPSTTTTRVSKSYILETLVYNLDEPEGKQLIGVVTSQIIDPSSVTETAKKYSKLVFNSFNKK
ncbi:MAG: hypothetical protein HN879_03940 [Flavobacteriaceae bacterium]|nr:hypothetical protein [Flavobacteriaceae bacterium]